MEKLTLRSYTGLENAEEDPLGLDINLHDSQIESHTTRKNSEPMVHDAILHY